MSATTELAARLKAAIRGEGEPGHPGEMISVVEAETLIDEVFAEVEAAPSDTDVPRSGICAECGCVGYHAINCPATRTSQPVQVEVTDDMVRRGAIALYVREFNFPPDADEQATDGFEHHYGKPSRAALSAALGGGDHAE